MDLHTLCFVIVGLFIAKVSAISDEMQELIDVLHNTCIGETGANPDHIVRANKGDFDEDEKFKCYINCLMIQMSCISDDGVVDADAVTELMPPEIKDKVAPTIKKCGSKVGASPCENAWLTHKCYQEGMGELYFMP